MAQKPTPDYKALKAKVQELAKGPKNREAVEAMLKRLSSEGIPQKKVLSDDLFANRQDILDRVQERAEEYEQVNQSCAKSPALALMEAFGFGNIKIITALSSLPGVALTGETCGAVLGGLVALSSYFGSEDLLDYSANGRCYAQCRKFIYRFEKEMGSTKCRDIHEKVVFGRYHAVADMKEGYPAFLKDKGFEKCALAPGISARIAAEIIFENIEKGKK
ncbi:MAG: C-GCAxxG-C-C family protein [Desulfobacteraceae bacterium]|jgi:C_GCAxxG_C_C family probable redox protein